MQFTPVRDPSSPYGKICHKRLEDVIVSSNSACLLYALDALFFLHRLVNGVSLGVPCPKVRENILASSHDLAPSLPLGAMFMRFLPPRVETVRSTQPCILRIRDATRSRCLYRLHPASRVIDMQTGFRESRDSLPPYTSTTLLLLDLGHLTRKYPPPHYHRYVPYPPSTA